MTAKDTALDSLKTTTEGMKLLGEIITFGGRKGPKHKHYDVVKALTDAGLDPSVARSFLPRNAWTRACRKLTNEQVIDVVKETPEAALFQFSKRHLEEDTTEGGQQVEYRKDYKIRLDKVSGKLTCKDETILARAQSELDRCLEERTTNDVTRVVQKLFDTHADLIPLPNTVGVYFVPHEHGQFTAKIAAFLDKLGRKPYAFPVPAGVQDTNVNVAVSVQAYLKNLISDHLSAVDGFTVTTRESTLSAAADRINETRVKIQAYAGYLEDRRDELLASVQAAQEHLEAKVSELDTEKTTPARSRSWCAAEGSFAARFNAALLAAEEPLTVKQLTENAGMEGMLSVVLGSHAKQLVKDGCAVWVDGLLAISPDFVVSEVEEAVSVEVVVEDSPEEEVVIIEEPEPTPELVCEDSPF